MSEIYALCCPETGVVRYIGKANNSAARLKSHLRDARRRDTPVYRWIRKLAEGGRRPALTILASDCRDWKTEEREQIQKHRLLGKLLNVADGGDEPFCSYDTRAANGRNAALGIHSNPRNQRIWYLKKELGLALKNGYLSERAKANMRLAAQIAPQTFGSWAGI